MADSFQLLGQAVAAVLGLAEHQHLVGVSRRQDVDQQVALAGRIDRVRAMDDGLGDGVLRRDLDLLRRLYGK